MKNNDTRDRLINAGADALADALIRLAERHNDNRARHPFAGLTPMVSE